MSEIEDSDLDHLSPRSDASILFSIDPISGSVEDRFFGSKNISTGLFDTHLTISYADGVNFRHNRITVKESLPDTVIHDGQTYQFSATICSLYQPLQSLSQEEREALAYLSGSSLEEAPKSLSTGKKVPVEDDKAAEVLTRRFKQRGVNVSFSSISPTMTISIDGSRGKRTPVRMVSGTLSGSKEQVEDILLNGVGKGKNYGCGLILIDAQTGNQGVVR